MNNFISVSLILCFALFSISCDPTACRNCEPFDYEIENWVPLENMDTLIYSKENGEIINFYLKEEVYSDSFEHCERGIKKSEDVYCEKDASLIYTSSEFPIEFKKHFYFSDGPLLDEVYLTYSFKNNSDSIFQQTAGLRIEPESSYTEQGFTVMDNVSINGEEFSDVIEIKIDSVIFDAIIVTDSTFFITKYLLKRGRGILLFENIDGTKYYLEN